MLRSIVTIAALLLGATAAMFGCAERLPPPAAVPPAATAGPPVPARPVLPDIAGPEAGFAAAMDLFRKGDMQAAALYAQSVMERYPHTSWEKRSLLLLGRALIARGMTAEAEKVLLRAPAEYPDLADYALFALAEHHAAGRRSSDAASLYQRVTDNYPASVLAPRASLRRAQVLFESGRLQEAVSAYERTLKDYPRSDQAADAALGLGRSRAEAGDLAGAVQAYQLVRVKYPGNGADAEAGNALAALAGRGATVPKLTGDEWYERARNLQRTLQYDKAVESFRAALDAAPSHAQKADILLRSGVVLFNLGKRSEAASVLERLIAARLPDCRCAEALFWLGKSYSRLGLREQAVSAYLRLVRTYPESEWADDALYFAGNVYRDAGDMKQALKFYRRLADEYPDSSFADSGLWWEGWSRYAVGDYAKARSVLRELAKRYPRSYLANQALYWQARAAERMGDHAASERLLRKVVDRGPYTFYGYRAVERLGKAGLSDAMVAEGHAGTTEDADSPEPSLEDDDLGGPDGPPAWTDDAIAALSAKPAYRKALELMYQDMKQEAAAELRTLQNTTSGKRGSLIGVSKAFFELGDYYSSMTVILRNFERSLERPSPRLPDDLWLLAYPQGFWPSINAASRRYGMDPYFVAAIIREESQFRTDAVSPAGARGVMQVMPSTGEWIARAAGIAGFDRSRLFEPDTNITVGTWYLSRLMQRFQGDLYRVSAAYNAGPEAVAGWASSVDSGDPVAFVEAIPYMETRSYVKRVLRNYAEYRRLYGESGMTTQPPIASTTVPAAASASPSGMLVCRATGSCPASAGGR